MALQYADPSALALANTAACIVKRPCVHMISVLLFQSRSLRGNSDTNSIRTGTRLRMPLISGHALVRQNEERPRRYEIRDTRSDNCRGNAAVSICSRATRERAPLTFDDRARQTMANWEQAALKMRRFVGASRRPSKTQCLRELALSANAVRSARSNNGSSFPSPVISDNPRDNRASFSSLFIQRVKKLLEGRTMSGKITRFHCKYLRERKGDTDIRKLIKCDTARDSPSPGFLLFLHSLAPAIKYYDVRGEKVINFARPMKYGRRMKRWTKSRRQSDTVLKDCAVFQRLIAGISKKWRHFCKL